MEKEKKKKQKEKETSETPVTMDFVEVSTRKKKRTKKKKKTGGENEETPIVPAFRGQKKRPVVNSVIIAPKAGMTYAQILRRSKEKRQTGRRGHYSLRRQKNCKKATLCWLLKALL